MRLRSFCQSGLLAVVRRAVCVFAVLTLPAVRADIQNPGRSSFPGDRALDRQGEKPPNGVPQTASVVEGGTVTIVLRARGHAGEMVDFLIRTPPEHGTIDGDPRQLTLNTASVSYTHRAGDTAAADSFTYVVQTHNSPVSSEVRVTVRIQDAPPVLAVSPAELDFGAVKAGGSTRAEITLVNQGGGEAVGRLDAPPPWVVDGPAEYRLPHGASQTFALVFKPLVERAYVDAIHFRNETGNGVRLVGTGLAGPGQVAAAGASQAGASVGRALASDRAGFPGSAVPAPPPVANASTSMPAVPTSSPAPANPGVTSLEPNIQGGGSFLPPSVYAGTADPDDAGVTSFEIRDRGRSTLDLNWRAPVPAPKSYRVEMRYLSLDADDRLVVDWRPYALTEFEAAHGFVTAHLSGLPAATQHCLRVVAVDAAGRLSAPSILRVTYTLPAATWWRPTPLKVLFLLLILCGGMVSRDRWETHQMMREIDESRRRAAKPAGSWG